MSYNRKKEYQPKFERNRIENIETFFSFSKRYNKETINKPRKLAFQKVLESCKLCTCKIVDR